jgi:hypothetical protein
VPDPLQDLGDDIFSVVEKGGPFNPFRWWLVTEVPLPEPHTRQCQESATGFWLAKEQLNVGVNPDAPKSQLESQHKPKSGSELSPCALDA